MAQSGELEQAVEATSILDTAEAGPRAVRGAALRVMATVASILLSVGAAALLTRHLGAVGYGRFNVVVSVSALVTGVAEAGLSAIGVREYSVRTGADRAQMIASFAGMRLAFAALGLGVSLAFGLVAGYPGVMIGGLALTGLGMALLALQQTWNIPLIVGLRFGWVSALDVGRLAGQTALTALFVILGGGLTAFYAIPIPVGVALLVAMVPMVRGRVPLLPSISFERWKHVARLIAPYAAATAVSTIYVYVATVVMSLAANANQVGYFSVSFRIFLVLGGIAAPAVSTVFPILARAARDDQARLELVTRGVLESSLIFGAWLAILTGLCAPLAVQIVAGGKFDPSVGVLQIQAAAVAGSFIAAASTQTMLSMHRNRPLVVLAATALAVSAALTAALAPSLGAKGGAIANLAGEGIAAVGSLTVLARASRGFLPSARVVAWVLAAAGAALMLALVPGVPQVPLGAGATVVFFGLLLAGRAIPAELLAALRRSRRA